MQRSRAPARRSKSLPASAQPEPGGILVDTLRMLMGSNNSSSLSKRKSFTQSFKQSRHIRQTGTQKLLLQHQQAETVYAKKSVTLSAAADYSVSSRTGSTTTDVTLNLEQGYRKSAEVIESDSLNKMVPSSVARKPVVMVARFDVEQELKRIRTPSRCRSIMTRLFQILITIILIVLALCVVYFIGMWIS